MDIFWILLASSLAAINCSLIGSYLVLRKVAMMADAITHSVLPGIVLAFLCTGSKSSPVMLLGAGSTGLLASWLVAWLNKKVHIQSDASIGINFTWLFALGIILISAFSRKIDLDPDCVLYGEVAYVPLNSWYTASGIDMGPTAIYVLGLVLLLNLGFLLLCYKELFVTTFDAAFATTMGMRTNLWHYLLMGATSFTAVASFEVAGAILVVALFVVPASTAYLLCRRLPTMLWLSAFIGIIMALGGYLLAMWLNGSIAGAMVTVGGVLFFTTWAIKKMPRAFTFYPKERNTIANNVS
jgi:manganese/zinc/iron transport system permease protein